MKLLLVTFYYPPDLSAGSYRAGALVDALARANRNGLHVEVLTTRPHRYASYRHLPDEPGSLGEPDRCVTVTRLPVGLHRSGLFDQSFVFSGFAARALATVRGKRYDVVLATSSRLFTGFLGALIARRTGAALYLDVRDPFVDNVREMLAGRPGMAMLLPVLSLVERETFRRAARVNLVSEGFLEHYRQRFPNRDYSLFTNGIDEEFIEYDFSKPSSNGAKVIVYAGNIGLGQGMEKVVPEAARRLGPEYEFRIIGDGGQRAVLERRLREAGVRNVALVPPMDRESLKREYRGADYLLLHLNGFRALESVLPSKVFEYAATGKPILAGVRGHARKFITTEVERAAVFEPGDPEGMVDAVRSLAPGHSDRSCFKARFARVRIMDRMAADILAMAELGDRA